MFCVSFWECVILGSQAGRWTSILKSLATPKSFELMSWAFQQSDGLSEADYFLAQKAGTGGLWLCELGVIYSWTFIDWLNSLHWWRVFVSWCFNWSRAIDVKVSKASLARLVGEEGGLGQGWVLEALGFASWCDGAICLVEWDGAHWISLDNFKCQVAAMKAKQSSELGPVDTLDAAIEALKSSPCSISVFFCHAKMELTLLQRYEALAPIYSKWGLRGNAFLAESSFSLLLPNLVQSLKDPRTI